MPAFTGQLRSNEIFAALFNMIISQEVFADNVAGTYGELADESRVDGSLYGDSKLYYSTDALKSHKWGADAEAPKLLALARPKAPETQAIILDVFRQIDLTVDDYLSKRAWSTEGAFTAFNSVMLGWIRNTKRIYDSTTFNAYAGTAVALANRAVVNTPITAAVGSATGEEKNRLEAETIAQTVADLFVDLKDVSRDFNDYKQMRSHELNNIRVVWNSKWVNKIRYVDLPTIFHKDGLVEKFEERILPARYFGTKITAANITELLVTPGALDITTGYYSGTTGLVLRALEEMDVVDANNVETHLFAGDVIPTGTKYYDTTTAEFLPSYIEEADIICIIMDRRSIPFMSAFEVGTSFFNPKSLTTNHYLTWGHNSLEYLKGKPFIRVKAN